MNEFFGFLLSAMEYAGILVLVVNVVVIGLITGFFAVQMIGILL